MERDQASKFISDLLRLMVTKKASDLFITVGFPPAIRPGGTEIRPRILRAVTVLPQPDSPTRQTISSGRTSKLTPSTARAVSKSP